MRTSDGSAPHVAAALADEPPVARCARGLPVPPAPHVSGALSSSVDGPTERQVSQVDHPPFGCGSCSGYLPGVPELDELVAIRQEDRTVAPDHESSQWNWPLVILVIGGVLVLSYFVWYR